MKIAYKPEKLSLNIKPKLFAAGQRSMAIVDHDNYVSHRLSRSIPRTNFWTPSSKKISMRLPLALPKLKEKGSSETDKSWESEGSTASATPSFYDCQLSLRLVRDSSSSSQLVVHIEGTYIRLLLGLMRTQVLHLDRRVPDRLTHRCLFGRLVAGRPKINGRFVLSKGIL
jgi:hypothetical protein